MFFSFFFKSLIFKKHLERLPSFLYISVQFPYVKSLQPFLLKPYIWGLLTFEREFALLLSIDVFVSSLKIKKKMVQTVHDLFHPSLERFRVTFTANVTIKLEISQNRK